MAVALITGSSGLVGSEIVTHPEKRGWTVHSVDNNMRRELSGAGGDTSTSPPPPRVELHGFLAYLARRVRDNHHARDGMRAVLAFTEKHRSALVYSLGGEGSAASR